MKRNRNNSIEIPLLEQRIINEEYAKATLKKQLTLANMREYHKFGVNIDRNGGLI